MVGWWLIAAVGGSLVACSAPHLDYGDTRFACRPGDACPDGQTCIDGTCSGPRGPDGGDDGRADAAPFTVRREGAPHVAIPDNEPAGVSSAPTPTR